MDSPIVTAPKKKSLKQLAIEQAKMQETKERIVDIAKHLFKRSKDYLCELMWSSKMVLPNDCTKEKFGMDYEKLQCLCAPVKSILPEETELKRRGKRLVCLFPIYSDEVWSVGIFITEMKGIYTITVQNEIALISMINSLAPGPNWCSQTLANIIVRSFYELGRDAKMSDKAVQEYKSKVDARRIQVQNLISLFHAVNEKLTDHFNYLDMEGRKQGAKPCIWNIGPMRIPTNMRKLFKGTTAEHDLPVTRGIWTLLVKLRSDLHGAVVRTVSIFPVLSISTGKWYLHVDVSSIHKPYCIPVDSSEEIMNRVRRLLPDHHSCSEELNKIIVDIYSHDQLTSPGLYQTLALLPHPSPQTFSQSEVDAIQVLSWLDKKRKRDP